MNNFKDKRLRGNINKYYYGSMKMTEIQVFFHTSNITIGRTNQILMLKEVDDGLTI